MTFQAQPKFWDNNMQLSEAIHTRPALLCSPYDEDIDGIAIFGARGPLCVITTEAAYRLATQIADHLQHFKEKQR